MVRKPFTLIAALTGLSMLVGTFLPVQAKADISAQPFANTAISDYTWAGADNTPSLVVYSSGMNWDGSVRGSFFAATATWMANGVYTNADSYADEDGEHADVTAYVVFSNVSGGVAMDYTPAFATFHALKKADGSTSEGIEVTDLLGNVLSSTGRDADGAIQLLPVLRGSIFMCH